MRALTAMLLAAGLALGCQNLLEPALDESFTLAVGQGARVADGGLLLRLAEVANDSRCPAGSACVWAGDAVVRLDAAASGDSVRLELHTNSAAGATRADVGRFTVELQALAPQPRSGAATPQDAYRATLRVSER